MVNLAYRRVITNLPLLPCSTTWHSSQGMYVCLRITQDRPFWAPGALAGACKAGATMFNGPITIWTDNQIRSRTVGMEPPHLVG